MLRLFRAATRATTHHPRAYPTLNSTRFTHSLFLTPSLTRFAANSVINLTKPPIRLFSDSSYYADEDSRYYQDELDENDFEIMAKEEAKRQQKMEQEQNKAAERERRRRLGRVDVSRNRFKDLHLRPELLQALSSYDINTPTEIQRLAINGILGGKSVQLAAQTGNGKTLAFVLPIIHRLREEEDQGLIVRPSRPRALILAPSRELAQQIHSVIKSLCHYAKIRSMLVISGHGRKKQKQALTKPIDVVVATPGRLQELINSQEIFLSEVRYTVLDEADTLCDPKAGFVELIEDITTPIRKREKQNQNRNSSTGGNNQVENQGGVSNQFILVGASFKKESQTHVEELFPEVESLRDAQVPNNPINPNNNSTPRCRSVRS